MEIFLQILLPVHPNIQTGGWVFVCFSICVCLCMLFGCVCFRLCVIHWKRQCTHYVKTCRKKMQSWLLWRRSWNYTNLRWSFFQLSCGKHYLLVVLSPLERWRECLLYDVDIFLLIITVVLVIRVTIIIGNKNYYIVFFLNEHFVPYCRKPCLMHSVHIRSTQLHDHLIHTQEPTV